RRCDRSSRRVGRGGCRHRGRVRVEASAAGLLGPEPGRPGDGLQVLVPPAATDLPVGGRGGVFVAVLVSSPVITRRRSSSSDICCHARLGGSRHRPRLRGLAGGTVAARPRSRGFFHPRRTSVTTLSSSYAGAIVAARRHGRLVRRALVNAGERPVVAAAMARQELEPRWDAAARRPE
ncbi:unnamed protein product, partial [Ectocarpus sp. 13 AM-2016]